jgi:tetratricopeptide (TPR) repeat protein
MGGKRRSSGGHPSGRAAVPVAAAGRTRDALLAQAVQHHQAGRLAEAEALYRRILHREPRQPDALHLLGVLTFQRGDAARAAELIGRAIAALPGSAEMHFNLGVVLARLGRPAEAAASYRRAIALQPAHAGAHLNLGTLLRDAGRVEEALASYRRAAALAPRLVEAQLNLGALLCQAGRPAEAVPHLRQAAVLRPDDAMVLQRLGDALRTAGQLTEASEVYQRALALRPDSPEVRNSLAVALAGLGRLDEAAEQCRLAIAAAPEQAVPHDNLGAILTAQGEFAAAIDCHRRALALQPGLVAAHNNLGNALRDSGRLEEAVASFQRALDYQPDHAAAHVGLALTYLLQGDLARGFAEFEWRWRWPEYTPAPLTFAEPPWDGGDLAGRTILLHAEQGFGDTLQFVRYVPRLAARGGRVVLVAQPALAPLLARLSGVARLLGEEELVPPFDVHAPLLSLPHLFGTTLATVPAEVPYLTADPVRQTAWAERLRGDGRLRVGLVWAGNPGHKKDRWRSLPLAALAPLAGSAGVTFYSLQKGPAAEQAGSPPPGLVLRDLGPELTDFGETAAVVANLDLIITVDTAVAHLAGALGRPVWLLLSAAPDWRWQRTGERSPWYPTMRLFRQEELGVWRPVVARVAAALRALTDGA